MGAWEGEHQHHGNTALLLIFCHAGAHALAAASEKGMKCVALQQQHKIAGNALWCDLTQTANTNQQCLWTVNNSRTW
jgi:hypothetical protein